MEILTNIYNLPETIVRAARNDQHRVSGNCSVTQIIDSPQIRLLKMKNDYTVDVSEKLDALLGTALHHVLEQSNVPEIRKRSFLLTVSTIRQEAEKLSDTDNTKATQLQSAAKYIEALIPIFFPEINQRYMFEKTMSVEVEHGFTLYGTFDLYDFETGFIHDYKSCSVYKWIFPESRKQWIAQLNVYAWLLMHEGYKVNGLRINPFYKDWSHSEFTRNKDYPSARIMEVPIELRSFDEIGQYIAKRVKLHRDAEAGNIPDCTGKERWSTADQYAVKEKGGKRAINGSIKATEIEARNFVEETKHKFAKELYIEKRPGESKRCNSYCPVNKVCPQYKKEQELIKELENNK
jgi:hypothetical protein